MTKPVPRYLGSEAQQALLHRGRTMFEITRGDPNFTYYGRTVGLATLAEGTRARLAALAQMQGNASCTVPETDIPDLFAWAETRGVKPVHYVRWVGGDATLAAARAIVAENDLPDGLRAVWIDADTPDAILSSFAETALACGVLPPALAVMRDQIKPGLTLLACNESGHVASCAGAASFFDHTHPDASVECWWGMLATDPEWRGRRLALILGARVLIEMHDRFGFTRVFTGVEPGNAPSEALCARMGLSATDSAIFGIADPTILPGGRMTK